MGKHAFHLFSLYLHRKAHHDILVTVPLGRPPSLTASHTHGLSLTTVVVGDGGGRAGLGLC